MPASRDQMLGGMALIELPKLRVGATAWPLWDKAGWHGFLIPSKSIDLATLPGAALRSFCVSFNGMRDPIDEPLNPL